MKQINKDSKLNSFDIDYENELHKTVIHPPTFPSVVAAYAFFTRNEDNFRSDYEDDSDDIPEVIPDDIHDLIDNMPVAPSKKLSNETPSNDGQRATTDEPQSEEGESSSSSEKDV